MILFGNFCSAHPFYVSTTRISLNEQNQSIEITSKIFTDDLELALKEFTGKAHFLDKAPADSVLEQYFLKNFNLVSSNKSLEHTFLGYEIKEDITYIYIEIEKVKKNLKEIEVINSLLLKSIENQKNIVNVQWSEYSETLLFDKRHKVHHFKPNQ